MLVDLLYWQIEKHQLAVMDKVTLIQLIFSCLSTSSFSFIVSSVFLAKLHYTSEVKCLFDIFVLSLQ